MRIESKYASACYLERMRLATLVLLLAAATLPAAQTTKPPATVPPLSLDVTRATRLLVLAPHPDDEAIAAAGLISRVVNRGGAVQIVLLTSGDGFPEAIQATEGIKNPKTSDYRNFGVIRERETRNAMTSLGVRPNAITFLGFPDGGLCTLASRYLYDKRNAFESPYTDRARPPRPEQVVRGSRYRGVDVRRELEEIVSDFKPTVIVIPHPEDEHPDHCSTHIFIREALVAITSQRRDLRVLHYLVHYGQWPVEETQGTGTLAPPPGFPPAEGRWESFDLRPEEMVAKERAISAYVSQTQVIGRLLHAFVRANELYLEGEPASPPECWCDGSNVATELTPGRYRRRP